MLYLHSRLRCHFRDGTFVTRSTYWKPRTFHIKATTKKPKPHTPRQSQALEVRGSYTSKDSRASSPAFTTKRLEITRARGASSTRPNNAMPSGVVKWRLRVLVVSWRLFRLRCPQETSWVADSLFVKANPSLVPYNTASLHNDIMRSDSWKNVAYPSST